MPSQAEWNAQGLCHACQAHNQLETNKTRCRPCLDKAKQYNQSKGVEYWAEASARTYLKTRKAALDLFGHQCAWCGQSRYEFLTFDHVNNDGAQERMADTNNRALIRWMVRNGPREDIQVLCWNCNSAKQFYGFTKEDV